MGAPRGPRDRDGVEVDQDEPVTEDITVLPVGDPGDATARRLGPPVGAEPTVDEDVEVFVSSLSRAHSSGAYASLVAADAARGPASLEAPPDEPAVALFPLLPEMSADIWQAGVRALVNVPDAVDPPWFDEAYWRDLGSLLLDERALVTESFEQVELSLAAARVAERLGEGAMATRLVDEARALSPDAVAPWRATGRLREAAGDFDGALEAWRQLTSLAPDADERASYAALDAEWTLARRGSLDGLEGPALGAVPDGPARAFAAAELALVAGASSDAALALEEAAFAVGGATGAAILEGAARLHEASGDAAAAAEQRFVAARMDAAGAPSVLGRLRDAARRAPEEAEAALGELRRELPPSALAGAVGRWQAALARGRGDVAAARTILRESVGPSPSAALVRDRLDLALALTLEEANGAAAPGVEDTAFAAAFDDETRARARAACGTPAALAALSLLEATVLAVRGDLAGAVACLRQGAKALPDAPPLGVLAEEIARASGDPELRIAAFELSLGVDPARRGASALALVEAIDARGGAGAELSARAALQTAMEAAPGSATFWSTAARDARAGRAEDAAATMAFGAELWAGSRLGGPLAERAAEMATLTSADGGLVEIQALASPGPSELERLLTVARAVVRAGGSADRHAWLTDQVSILGDGRTRAWWWIRRALALPPGEAGDERLASLDAALAKVPAHPVALALLLGDAATPASRAAHALAAAGAASDGAAWRVAAVNLAGLAGESETARDLAAELVAALPGSSSTTELAIEIARAAGGTAAAAEIVARLPADVGDDAQTLRFAEALEHRGEPARAAEALAALEGGPLAADGRRARARLRAESPGAGLPLELFARPADQQAEQASQGIARLRRAAAQGRSGELAWLLAKEPPHAAAGDADALALAALVEEAADGARAVELRGDAAAPEGARFAAVARAAESPANRGVGGLERAATLASHAGDARSAAVYLTRAAGAHLVAGAWDEATRCLDAAALADPEALPVAMAARRAAAAREALGPTIEAAAREADLALQPAARVRALLRAAELARAGADAGSGRARALALYRRVLAIEPANEAAFAGERGLLEAARDDAALAETLAARIAVARNPFELTALRLARAELLAGSLGDRAGAKIEWQTILAKEPQHPRALARLSDLQYEDGEFAAAGELYLRRAIVERHPTELREILLRLGRIYTKHVLDGKRAIGAYARVAQTEDGNHEALAALSDLYLAAGDAKNALAATEALLTLESEPAAKLALLIRAGQLHERLGDQRHAGARFRQAVDEAPRDLSAVTELARFLERSRDVAGRRAMLDHSVGLLRHDVERGLFDRTTLEALVPLLQLRGKTRAAAAGAQLLAALGDEASRAAVGSWAAPPQRGRRLAALARPELDERIFSAAMPPGVRHVFRLVGSLLAKGAADLARHGVTRAERLGRGHEARDVFDGVTAELGLSDVDVFVRVRAARQSAAPLRGVRVEPGERAAVILGPELPALGGRALRFAAARALRLVATHLDLVLAASPAEAGALVGGVVRQFVPEYRHPGVRDELLAFESERVAKLLPRKLKQEVMPFAIESAGAFDLDGLHAAVRDGANAFGLLACGDLPAALAVLLAGSGLTLAPPDLVRDAEALALLRFALSDDHDELATSME